MQNQSKDGNNGISGESESKLISSQNSRIWETKLGSIASAAQVSTRLSTRRRIVFGVDHELTQQRKRIQVLYTVTTHTITEYSSDKSKL